MNMDQYIGRLLDNRYEILEVIGTGGMAVVYKARCHRLNRLVAIKILKDEFARDEEFRRRFHAEGEAVAMLSHPNIVQVYDVSSSDSANFIVMELIDGISLKQYMESKGVLNWKETLHFAMQIAKGLEHAHSRGIVHRDIKPHNVMVLKNGSVKVMDFGIARVMNKSNTLTKEALGSVHYISPEQAKGGYTDNRSDLYSLSVVMYEMMTGRPPYDGESAVAVAIQHINGGAPMPSTLNPNIPGGMEQIIMKGMALDVNDRYASATEMLQDMEEFRKNPAILFGYTYKSVLDDATRPIGAIPTPQPKTTAEKVVQAKTGTPPRPRTSSDSARIRQSAAAAGTAAAAGAAQKRNTGKVSSNTASRTRDAEAIRRAQQRRKAEEERREEERSRVATVAIVVCSIVAIIAIAIFLVALFNGALLNREMEYVEVPYLEGKMYSESLSRQYSNLVIVLEPQQYDDTFEKGQIIHQEPLGGSKVSKGTELHLTISMGKEPQVKTMEDLTGVTKEEAKSFLDGQGLTYLFYNESSYVYEAGIVIRTDPAKDTEVTDGQTIKVWVSTGPEVVTAKMPNVMGLDKDRAIEQLNDLGFTNVRTRSVESLETKGKVVYQSQEKGVEIDVNTEIVLEYSEGPEVVLERMPYLVGKEESEAKAELNSRGFTNVRTSSVESDEPKGTVVSQSIQEGKQVDVTTEVLLGISEGPEDTTAATESKAETVTKEVVFKIPSRDKSYILTIQLDGKEVMEAEEIQPGTDSFTLELTGSGTQVYKLYINGEEYSTQEVKFSDG